MILENSKKAMGIIQETLAITEPWENKRIEHIQQVLHELKSSVLKNGFNDKADEICFFKVYKPFFSGHLMHCYQVQKIKMDCPDWSENLLVPFYQSKLDEVNVFFTKHREIASYYRSKTDHLDEILFLRYRTSSPTWLCIQHIDSDERFSTVGDYAFSQIIANELTAKYITSLVQDNGKQTDSNDLPPLKWTGDTINLIELAYGIHCTGQVNNGQAGIMDIIKAIARPFNVDIKRPYRRFNEIRQRKRLSRTEYIDKMGTALNQKLEDEEAYRP